MLDSLFMIKNESAENVWDVDMINLKLYGLLMCPGKQEQKADILFDMIFGPALQNANYDAKNRKNDVITWMNPRLIQAVRKLIYFSEIFPKKYLHYFRGKEII